MSRSGYSDDYGDDDPWQLIRWRGAVASAIRGKRGQAFLRELVESLDAMPEKRLIAHDLQVQHVPDPMVRWLFAGCDGAWTLHLDRQCGVCAIGSVGERRGVDLAALDPEDPDAIAEAFGVAAPLVRELEWMNDEIGAPSPEARWRNVRAWAVENLKGAAA